MNYLRLAKISQQPINQTICLNITPYCNHYLVIILILMKWKEALLFLKLILLPVFTLKVEATAWLEDGSCVCDQCPGEDEHVQNEVHALLICQDHRVCELRKHFSFLFIHLFLRTFQQPNPFCCNRSTTNLFMISFLSRTIDFFFFFLSLWIYLWLAETSQQPISQTTWLKVTPHCNHCNHCKHFENPLYVTIDRLSMYKLRCAETRG